MREFLITAAFLMLIPTTSTACGLLGMLAGPCSPQAVAQQANDACLLHGYKPGTPYYDACVRLATAEIQKGNSADFAHRLQRIGSAAPAAPAAPVAPAPPAPPPVVNCTTTRNGMFTNTTCF